MGNGECGTEKQTAPRSTALITLSVYLNQGSKETAFMDQPAAPEFGSIHEVIPCIQTLFRDIQANLPTPPSSSVTKVTLLSRIRSSDAYRS